MKPTGLEMVFSSVAPIMFYVDTGPDVGYTALVYNRYKQVPFCDYK